MTKQQDLVWLEPLPPNEIIEDELVKKKKIDKFHILYSGGQDSGSVANYCIKNYPEYVEKLIFTCTGIGSPVTREFVINYANEQGWELHLTYARKSYYDIIIEHGFPGPGSHRIIMGYLKFQSWYYYYKDFMKGRNACFISGVRKKESMVRDKKRFYTRTPIDINAGMIFCRPFLYKNGTQLQEYFIKEGLKKSPAYDYFGKSGECWCGCFYNEWELKMLEKHDPFVFNTIRWYEKQIRLHGTKEAKRNPYWGRSVGADVSEMQSVLGDFKINEDYCGESCGVDT